jgi:hypothetical protein
LGLRSGKSGGAGEVRGAVFAVWEWALLGRCERGKETLVVGVVHDDVFGVVGCDDSRKIHLWNTLIWL